MLMRFQKAYDWDFANEVLRVVGNECIDEEGLYAGCKQRREKGTRDGRHEVEEPRSFCGWKGGLPADDGRQHNEINE